MIEEWRPDLVQHYFTDMHAKSQPRPYMNLPWSPNPGVLPPEDVPFTVKWTGTRSSVLERNGKDGTLTVTANGRRWRFASASAPLLDLLLSGRARSLEELEERAGTLSGTTIRAFLRELAENGLITMGSEAPLSHDG